MTLAQITARTLAWLLLSASPILPQSKHQEPKPVPEQCRVEGKAWDTVDLDYWRRFPYSELSRRVQEMYDCTQVDKSNELQYTRVAAIVEVQMDSREMGFLLRHKMWDTFVDEDGKAFTTRGSSTR